jgi:hypothetical protein
MLSPMVLPLGPRLFFVCLLAISGPGGPLQANPIPDQLLDDPHFRSEFGLNEITTPSIQQVFAMVKNLAPLSRNRFTPSPTLPVPVDRSALALSLGGLIAEGFFLVRAREVDALQSLAQRISNHCSALGTGDRVTRHAKALLEAAARGAWDPLEKELASTQREIEGELVALRDVGTVHLISLGGWIRAFELASAQVETEFSVERAELLRRVEVAEYFLDSLQYLEPTVQEQPFIRSLQTHVAELVDLLRQLPTPPTPQSVGQLHAKALLLSSSAFSPPR